MFQGCSEKLPAFEQLLSMTSLRPEQVCAIGDDLPDLPVLQRTGLAIAVADACPELRAMAHYTTTLPGGRGAVRDAIEWLLKLRGEWAEVIAPYAG